MAPLPKKTIEHFTHPNHQLFQINNDSEYLCDGCKTFGIGTRFRCHGCDFDLHEYCGTCPMTLSSFMHSQHQLNLVLRQPQATRQNDRRCDVCGDRVEGLFYRCKLCEFDVHPVCTQLPQKVQHFQHPEHPLTLQPFSSTRCLVCGNECTSWRYRCGICCVDIHLECLLSPGDASMSTSTPKSRSVRQSSAPSSAPPPGFGAYAYEVPRPSGIAYAYGVQAPPFVAFNHVCVGVPPGFIPSTMYQHPGFIPSTMYQHLGFIPSTMYHHHPPGNQQVGGEGHFRNRIYKLVQTLTLGVITSGMSAALFGI